jgi:hypothetical protein
LAHGGESAVLTEEARSAVALWCKIDGDCSASATGAGQADSPTWGSCPGFLLVARSGCARGNRRGGWLGSFFAPEQRRKGREKGSGASLGVPRREEEEEKEGGPVHVVLMLGQPTKRGHSGDDHCRVV